MPLVQIHAIKGVFSPETKKKIIEKVTDAMVQVEGENLRRVTVVTINEIDSGDWGIGGKPLTTEAVKEMASAVTLPERGPALALKREAGPIFSLTIPMSALGQ